MSCSLRAARALLGLAAALWLGTVPPAGAAGTPETLAGATLANADKTKGLTGTGARIIDTRGAAEYAESHIKGALSVPYKEKSEKAADFDPREDSFDLARLPFDKNLPLVAYCNGTKCWKSYKAARAMVKAGYKKVYWFRDGFPAWKAKGYPVE